MASSFCADCGASVKFGESRCWVCHKLLPWKNDADKAAVARKVAYFRKYPGTLAGFVVAAILMVPAVAIAFFVTGFITCVAAVRADGPMGMGVHKDWIDRTSLEVALVVFIVFVILLIFLGRSAFRKIPL
jgi:hypothetical protein